MEIFADIENNKILLKSLEEEKNSRQKEVESLREQYQDTIKLISDLKSQEEDSKAQHEDAKNALNDFLVIRDNLVTEIGELNIKRINIVKDTNLEKDKIISSLENQNKELVNEYKELEDKIDALKEFKKSIDREIDSSKKYVDSCVKKEQIFKDTLSKKVEELNKIDFKISDAKVELDITQERNKTLVSINDELDKSIIEKKKNVISLTNQTQDKENKLNKISEEYIKKSTEFKELDNRVNDIIKREGELAVSYEQIKTYYKQAGIPFQL